MPLILYTKTGCPWCAEVLEFLREKEIPFEEREVRRNPAYLKELLEKSGQTMTPTLVFDLPAAPARAKYAGRQSAAQAGGEILADTDVGAVEQWLKEKDMLK